ncbi:hypothetical protein Ddc_00163 [Ditylenchus destructor]|nr:hypothetical protein Ddc_00163 [Ditylenchus destructor]
MSQPPIMGPLGLAYEKMTDTQKETLKQFIEANKGLKVPEFRAKIDKEFVSTLPADLQAIVKEEKEKLEKKKALLNSAESSLSDAAKTFSQQFRALIDHNGITFEEQRTKIKALLDSMSKEIVEEFTSKGFPIPGAK